MRHKWTMFGWLTSLLLFAGIVDAGTLQLAWNASQGATSYKLYYGATDGPPYQTILDTGTATTASVSGLTDGTRYYFAATALNGAAESGYSNEVNVVVSTPPPVTSINDTAFSYSGGGWSVSTGVGKYQNDDHYTNRKNSRYSLTFTGTKASVFVATAAWHGRAAISIDGGPETTVDLYSSTKIDQVLIYTSPTLPVGTHTVRVRCVGSHSAQSSGNYITGDRIDVTP